MEETLDCRGIGITILLTSFEVFSDALLRSVRAFLAVLVPETRCHDNIPFPTHIDNQSTLGYIQTPLSEN
jgi:hypothetical protein